MKSYFLYIIGICITIIVYILYSTTNIEPFQNEDCDSLDKIVQKYLYMFPHKNRKCIHDGKQICNSFKLFQKSSLYEPDEPDESYEDIDFLSIHENKLEGVVPLLNKWRPLVHSIGTSPTIPRQLESLGYLEFEKVNSENIVYYCPNDTLSITPKTIYMFWTGTNAMSDTRKASVEQVRKTSGCNLKLITVDTINSYIMNSHPLHPAYKYLSETHKSDYLRTYFMHFYGGGYNDVKRTEGDWNSAFDDLINHPGYVANGTKEIERGVAYDPYKKYWQSLIGNGSYIVRPNTEFTRAWYSEMIQLMDKKIYELEQHPAKEPQDRKELNSGYPIEWSEMLGRIFHKHNYHFKDRILTSTPAPIIVNYA